MKIFGLRRETWAPLLIVVASALCVAAAVWTAVRLQHLPGEAWEQERRLRVGYAVEAPYAYVDKTVRVTGEAPETFRLVAQSMGVERVDWIQVPFSVLIPDLLAGRIDVIAAGMFVTPERQELVGFTQPTLLVGSGVLVNEDAGVGDEGIDSWLRVPGRQIAVIAGSVEAARLQQKYGENLRLVVVPDARTGANAVDVGRADGLALSWPTLYWTAQSVGGSNLKAIRLPLEQGDKPDRTAFVVRKEHVRLRQALDTAIADVIGTDRHLAVLREFGFTADDVPRIRSTP